MSSLTLKEFCVVVAEVNGSIGSDSTGCECSFFAVFEYNNQKKAIQEIMTVNKRETKKVEGPNNSSFRSPVSLMACPVSREELQGSVSVSTLP